MLARMVLGWEDIAGGTTILAFLIWLGFTGLFYLVNYMAALNVLDDLTQNNWIKVPAMLLVSFPSAFLMAIFNYNPFILFILMAISNYYRVRNLAAPDNTRFKGITLNIPLFYTASYLYIIATYAWAAWLQQPVELDGLSKPYWKTWFTEVPH